MKILSSLALAMASLVVATGVALPVRAEADAVLIITNTSAHRIHITFFQRGPVLKDFDGWAQPHGGRVVFHFDRLVWGIVSASVKTLGDDRESNASEICSSSKAISVKVGTTVDLTVDVGAPREVSFPVGGQHTVADCAIKGS